MGEIIAERKELVAMLSDRESKLMQNLLNCAFSLQFKHHRDSHIDMVSLLDCCLEIVASDVDERENAMKMAQEIQVSLSNQEVRDGWRVSFQPTGKSHRFYYLNDRIKERRKILFKCYPTCVAS